MNAIQVAIDTALGNVEGQAVSTSNTYTNTQIEATRFDRPFIPDGADFNDYTATGSYAVRYPNQAGMLNAPSTAAGRLIVGNTNHPTLPAATHLFLGYAGAGVLYRSQGSSGAWTAWDRLDKLDAGQAQAHRAMLVSAFKARRGGVVGTSGKIPVSLRFDHGLAKFGTKILPLLQKYDLPWSQAINSNQMGNAGNTTTFATFSQWCIDNGGEAWNHGRDHISATGPAPILQQIVTALASLQSNLPALSIEGWAPPGVTAGGFDGYSPMTSAEQHWNTYAGQLVLAYHAAVAGYLPGLYRSLPADMPIGLGHTTIEAQTPAWVSGVLNGAINSGMGVQLMLHPASIDTAGFMTTANVETVFADLAARRVAGTIEILTPTGSLLADPNSNHRDDLITNGSFRNGFTGWANTLNWTTAVSGNVTYATTTTGTPLTQTISLNRREALLGGTRELVYRVRATTGAVVRTNILGTGMDARKEHTLSASPNWVEVRKPVTIPANFTGELIVAAGRVSGGTVDITNARLQSI
ncbi:hypothetical protein [Arthrobacter sp. 147(2020)]|uniref:hypothetical protein n=2 Tax=unclassified Arthrobacter TaxID=235627 RepID=UPI001493191D|nr:hypothetical protein [Arthrobacter sp. 147(2020)]